MDHSWGRVMTIDTSKKIPAFLTGTFFYEQQGTWLGVEKRASEVEAAKNIVIAVHVALWSSLLLRHPFLLNPAHVFVFSSTVPTGLWVDRCTIGISDIRISSQSHSISYLYRLWLSVSLGSNCLS